MELIAQSVLGIVLIPLAVWALSENRKAVTTWATLRGVIIVLSLQVFLALLMLKLPQAKVFFDGMTNGVFALQAATDQGAQLLFGYLAGGEPPFDAAKPQLGYLLAFRVLPLILVLSALVRLFYYWGILQRVVAAVAFVLRRTVGAGGPLGTASAASIFLGLIEAPLMVRPYLKDMGRGAFFATMVVVMSTVAGTVMALYASVLSTSVPGVAGHLLIASLMNVPAALMLARLSVPDGFEGGPEAASLTLEDPPRSSMDAIAQGALDGLQLIATVASLLIVIVALVALVNIMLGQLPSPFAKPITLQLLLGLLFTPLAVLIGIPLSEASTAGALLGQKLVLNEFLAYLDFARILAEDPAALEPRSRLIMTYALCGFANLGSLGILIGGLTAMVPERRQDIVDLAPRAVAVGFVTTLLSAAIIGCMTWPS